MRGFVRIAAAGLLLLLAGSVGPASAQQAAPAPMEPAVTRSGPVAVVRVDGVINSASADHVIQAIRQAGEMGASVLVFELDTPGGVVTDTKDILQAILNAPLPIVVYVQPRGAWAGSAGTFITVAAHVAAMAPGSTIGAAHPVVAGAPNPKGEKNEEGETQHDDYMMEKLENMTAAYIEGVAGEQGRNVEWAGKAVRDSIAATAEEALALNVIDLIAEDREDLLAQLEGRVVKLAGKPTRISVQGARIEEIEMRGVTKLFHYIANPQIISILMLIGMLGIYLEYNSPGLIVPGAVGVVCLVLALLAMQTIPFSWTGVIFILLGLGFMVAEAFAPMFGIMVLIGAGFMLVGGSMVFDQPDLSDLTLDFWSVLVPLVATLAACMFGIVVAMGRTRGLKQVAGTYELVGMRGVAKTALTPEGTVFLRGEHWRATADEELPEGAAVEAVAVEGMRLQVKRASD